MYPGLPRAFPNTEWQTVADIFRRRAPVSFLAPNSSAPATADPAAAAEAWVQQEIGYYEANYTAVEDLNVCVTTFNVGCKKPALPLTSLACLTSGGGGADGAPARPTDLIVVGLQEVDMSATALFKQETEASAPWVAGLNAAIGADGSNSTAASSSSGADASPYYAFPPKQLVGLLLCVFIRRPLLSAVSESSTATVATGALGSMGNKGAVGFHLVLHRTSICIITAHLAAGQSNVSKRNEDINTIFKSMDFNAARRAEMQISASASMPMDESAFLELYPRDHDIIIVAGDLNYRLRLPYETAVQLANAGQFSELLQYDELATEMKSPHTPWLNFINFTPTHMPTYRFDVGTDVYDTSEKRRVPSYTDRICVWSRRKSMESRIRLDRLSALMEVRSSDHKPVQALARIPISVEVPAQKAQVLSALREKAAVIGLAQASSAKISLSTSKVNFQAQSFHHCGTQETVTVQNNGDCVAVVRVVRQREGDYSEGTWLRATPLELAILPGESQDVLIETAIDPRCMTWLAAWRPYQGRGRVSLTSVLLCCCRNGPVQAVECQCVLSPSVFGNGLDSIALLQDKPCVEAYAQKADFEEVVRQVRPHVPKELWYLAHVIAQHPREGGLFTRTTDKEVCSRIMELLDTKNAPLPVDTDVHCAAECLLTFLKSLLEPVVPYAQYTAALAAGRAKGKAPLQFLRQLPTMHANVWIYVMSLLNYLLRPVHSCDNELDANFLAHIFSAVLIVRPANAQGAIPTRLQQGGGVDQQVRQQLQQESDDALALVAYFLSTPPSMLAGVE
ncbi:inositol/phosphatidylinositol phosphatase [Leishmania donovani]|uniref:Endonuclease/Exonuclease/phosphatase family protein n=1 Tax=Leishmania donovani TaxID=5661 RepID=A0A3S5H6V6_LEIDO|nr:inositol/phosphatidylinositol phosphatase, putative [Leishmania donovani]AYU77535.1 inositol/phosphatidylinositol phosphatase, putative [Leishmania donovani]TPP47696.1 Endonuclease/Exonuclease/phosphatase family protein [Leishmania donovani]TPP53187.1 Endonuclease/Exonuclease/phosphatase family protein [Leishmania donovani]CAJ1987545.1 inositol/phosphatidylinositol phosphatase [Leishmania donovani]CBZ32935.1 inositol/phosphatidylinositol phosphatase, putative [Leishmania donovani]